MAIPSVSNSTKLVADGPQIKDVKQLHTKKMERYSKDSQIDTIESTRPKRKLTSWYSHKFIILVFRIIVIVYQSYDSLHIGIVYAYHLIILHSAFYSRVLS